MKHNLGLGTSLLVPMVIGSVLDLRAGTVSVDLGTVDQADGLANSQRGQNTDGENDPVSCGVASNPREGRMNRGAPDSYLYFLVQDPEVKGSSRLLVTATLYDDPSFSGRSVTVRLQYTNAASTGPGDLANTFDTHPFVPRLSGLGRWVEHTWKLSDAGFRTFMQGTSDFRFDFGSARVCTDRVAVSTDPRPIEPTEHLVAAHYYPWYTAARWNYSECAAGSLRLELVQPQPPLLGRYDSSTPSVVDQHLRWCAEYGVNVLVLEFIQPGSREDMVCRNVILPHRRSGDVRFSVIYDYAIRFGSFDVTPDRITTARADFDHLSQYYFPHPSFLKVRGAPLAMIYVTRAFTGDVDALIQGIRDTCAARGFDIFLVGDEFFFPSSPNATKIARWDGIFGYDAYGSRGGFWGSNGTLIGFEARTISYAAAAAANGVKFFPSFASGYNDRATRRTCADNPAMSRRLTTDGGPTSLFREVLREIALPHTDSELPLISITSFNEWHEDTQIEPTAGTTGSTSTDTSASGTEYTQNLVYDDYGLLFLEEIRDATIAFTGKVLDADGPIEDATVEVLDGDTPILVRRSFSTGVYTIPRLRLEAGKTYRLSGSAQGHASITSEGVTVEESVAVVDLTLPGFPRVSRGDCNDDSAEDISDAVALLLHLFVEGKTLPCLEACDIDADGSATVSDAIRLLEFIFRAGPPPAPPRFPGCERLEGAHACDGGNCE